MNPKVLWEEVLKKLTSKISKGHLLTYFQDTTITKLIKTKAVIGVSSPFTLETIRSRYHDMLLMTLQSLLPEVETLEYEITHVKKEQTPDIKTTLNNQAKKKQEPVKGIHSKHLNAKYQFGNFIVGNNNKLAFEAGKSLTYKEDLSFNPLFVHGNVGMGKTHLIQAIANEYSEKHPEKKVIYTTTEQFMNDLIESIGKKNTERFRKKYRDIDMLIIDDIQFLKGREKTQEEFFHTFNVLFDSKKPIILSADTPPNKLKGITERLVSRFQSGMIVKITTADPQTRYAIAQKKFQEKGFLIEEKFLHHISHRFEGSMRDLDGIITQVTQTMELMRSEISIELIDSITQVYNIDDVPQRSSLDPEYIIEMIAKDYEISVRDLQGQSRKQKISIVRQIAMFVLRHKLNVPFEDIGALFGNRNHTSVMYACKIVKEKMGKDGGFRKQVEKYL